MHETTPKSPTPWKVLFVCLGNICRSPAAEGIMKSLVSQSGLSDQIYVDSAGTSSYHIGALPDARMRAAASRRGYDLSSRARSILPKDLRDFDLVIAMDRDNYRAIHGLTSDAAPMCDWLANSSMNNGLPTSPTHTMGAMMALNLFWTCSKRRVQTFFHTTPKWTVQNPIDRCCERSWT